MFGIKDRSNRVLCHHYFGGRTGMTMYANWTEYDPVMINDQLEIDQLLQEISYTFADYSLTVFEFSEEQEREIIIRKLRGRWCTG